MEFFAISNGIPVHIWDSKKGDKTILLLHGYLETLYIFEDFAQALEKEGYRVIMLDLPGHGLSGSNKDINTMEFSATVAVDVLKKCGVDCAYVAGHSMGGYIAQNCIKLFPEFFKGLILLNSTPFADSDEKKENRKREIELVINSKIVKLANLSIPQMYSPANLRRLDEKIAETLGVIETHDPIGIVACIKGMMERVDTKDVLAKCTNAMAIYGDADKFITNETRDSLIAQFPNVKHCIVEGTGHNSFIENPTEVIRFIKEFAL